MCFTMSPNKTKKGAVAIQESSPGMSSYCKISKRYFVCLGWHIRMGQNFSCLLEHVSLVSVSIVIIVIMIM